MARRRKGRVVDGVLLLHKDSGLSSNQALQRVRHLYQAQKAGHGGTLDPFACGLLPILFGEASKFGQYLLEGDKRYRVTAQFGAETDSDDKDGEVIRRASVPDLTTLDWTTLLREFIGKQQQTPPIYSALKIGGQRAYDLARQGQTPVMPSREIEIFALELVACTDNQLTLDVHCGTGTYIRALVRDLARRIGSGAHAVALERLTVGGLGEPRYRLEQLQALEAEARDKLLLPLDTCVAGLAKVSISADKLAFITHGNDVEITSAHEGLCALYDGQRFIGVGEARKGRAYPKRLLRLNNNVSSL